MASIERRIEALEAQFGGARSPVDTPEDEIGKLRRKMLYAIIDEYAALKSSRAERWGGPKNSVRIPGEDIAGRELGPGYTTGAMVELAVRRVVERDLSDDLESPDFGLEAERLAEAGVALMRNVFEQTGRADKWDEVETR